MSDVTVDASELTAFGRGVASAHAKASIAVAKAVKKGAQNVKEGVISDLQTSSNYAISRIGIGYEMGSTGTTIYADVSPRDGRSFRLGQHRVLRHRERRRNPLVLPVRRTGIAHARRIRGRRGRRHADRSHRIMSVMDLTNAVLDLLPSMPSGVKVYRQEEPLESEMPPWIIAHVSTDRHVMAETMAVHRPLRPVGGSRRQHHRRQREHLVRRHADPRVGEPLPHPAARATRSASSPCTRIPAHTRPV